MLHIFSGIKKKIVSNHNILIDKTLRRILPSSLFGRSLLMILLPLLITQAISLELFYGNFLSTVTRRLTDMVANEVSYVVDQFSSANTHDEQSDIIQQSQNYLQLTLRWHAHESLYQENIKYQNILGPIDEVFSRTLKDRLSVPFLTDWATYSDQVKISIQLQQGVLDIFIAKKRLTAGAIWLFVVWIVGSAVLLFMITAIFAWIQFKAIRRLSNAVEQFGKGRDPGTLRLVGSRDLRNTAQAFNVMRERLIRFIKQRTVILASVSHDLRTPLTRLRLSLDMLPQKGVINAEDQALDIAEMITDTEEMEQMIAGYLSFARGEGTEEPQITDMVQLSEDVVASAYRAGTKFLSVDIPALLPDMMIRTGGIRRVLGNILENAKRYGGGVQFIVRQKDRGILFIIDDNGPGIPQENREKVFKPFETGNSNKGTGLGLAIAKNIIQAHGGDIELTHSPIGGLRVIVFIPK